MKELLFLVPVVGLAGLLFAIFLKSYVIKQDPGTDRMREIADAIAEGARAFLIHLGWSIPNLSSMAENLPRFSARSMLTGDVQVPGCFKPHLVNGHLEGVPHPEQL